jgi:hypothetical protein
MYVAFMLKASAAVASRAPVGSPNLGDYLINT